MGAKLQALIELQAVELQLVDIQRQLASRQRLIDTQRAKVRATETALEAEQAEIRRAQMQFNEIDIDVKARSAHIVKLREQLNSVRTNKEYAAALSQLNNDKADANKQEARALEMMQKLDERKGQLAEVEKRLEQERARLADLQAQYEQTRATYSGRLDELMRQRQAAEASVDPNFLQQFRKLAERYDGEVLAEVVKPNIRRDEYVCSGCNMMLRVEVANALTVRDDIMTCKSCGRILYMKKGG